MNYNFNDKLNYLKDIDDINILQQHIIHCINNLNDIKLHFHGNIDPSKISDLTATIQQKLLNSVRLISELELDPSSSELNKPSSPSSLYGIINYPKVYHFKF